MDKRNTKKHLHLLNTLGLTGFAYVVSYGITLTLTPYITANVGTDAYGFVTLAKQFAQYATIVTTALNTYAARYIGLAYHRDRTDEARTYFSSVFWGNVIVASAILLLSLVGIVFLDDLIHIPGSLVDDVKVLFVLTMVGFWVTTVFSVFGCAGYVTDHMDVKGLFKTLSFVTNAVVLILAYVLFPAKILYVGLGTLAASLVVALSDLWMSGKYLPDLNIRREYYSFAAVKKLTGEGFWMSFNMVGELLNNGLDLLVCNQMLTSLAMGQLAIAKTMNTIVQSLYTIVDQAFIPRFLKRYADGSTPDLVQELKLSMKFSGLLANLAFAGFVALGMAYYHLWIPGEDIPLVYKLTVVTILTCIPNGAIHPLYYIYTLKLKQKLPCFVTIGGGVFNVAGMYLLIKYAGMGVYAVAWTTVAVMCFINFVSNPLYMAHVMGLPKGTFYPDIIRNIIACAVMTAVFYGLTLLYTPTGWLTLILTMLCFAVLGSVIHVVIVLDRQQRAAFAGIFARLKK